MFKNIRGFTLIELLVVVALIGVLSAIGVTYYSGFKESSERKQAETTMQSISLNALIFFFGLISSIFFLYKNFKSLKQF